MHFSKSYDKLTDKASRQIYLVIRWLGRDLQNVDYPMPSLIDVMPLILVTLGERANTPDTCESGTGKSLIGFGL